MIDFRTLEKFALSARLAIDEIFDIINDVFNSIYSSSQNLSDGPETRKRRENPSSSISRSSFVGATPEDEDMEEMRGYDRTLNSKSFMPLGMLALRPANIRFGGQDNMLTRSMRECLAAVDQAMFESRGKFGRLTESQMRDVFVPECLKDNESAGGNKAMLSEIKHNVSASLAKRLNEAARYVFGERAEFHLLNLQGVLFPGNKTQLK